MKYFYPIYEAAKEKDPLELDQLLLTIPCVDEFKSGSYYLTPAAQLAYDGEYEAVERLIERGANVNYIALRAAMNANHFLFVDKLCNHYKADRNYVACGNACRLSTEEMKKNLFIDDVLKEGMDPAFIARSAALAGNEELVNFLTAHVASSHKTKCLLNIATAYAMGRHKDLAKKSIVETEPQAFLDAVLFGAAIIKDKDWVAELKEQGASIEFAAQGYAFGGHDKKALACLELAQNKERVLNRIGQGAAMAGHHVFVNYLLHKYPTLDLAELIKGAKTCRHLKYSQCLEEKKQALAGVDSGKSQSHSARLAQLFGSSRAPGASTSLEWKDGSLSSARQFSTPKVAGTERVRSHPPVPSSQTINQASSEPNPTNELSLP